MIKNILQEDRLRKVPVKGLSLSVIMTIIVIFVLTSSAIAAALPGSGWWTGKTIQNGSSSAATIRGNCTFPAICSLEEFMADDIQKAATA
jgi:hypothetical protein